MTSYSPKASPLSTTTSMMSNSKTNLNVNRDVKSFDSTGEWQIATDWYQLKD